MKKIYLVLTCVLFQVLTKAESDFVVAEEVATLNINHRMMDQETLADIATYCALRQSALEKMNGISANKILKIGQEKKIILAKTNYYKEFERKNRPEYEALKYFVASSENLPRIAQHFFPEGQFLKSSNPQGGFRRGDLNPVGWIKILGMKQPVNISKPNAVIGQGSPTKKAVPAKAQNGQKTNKPAETKMAQPCVVINDPNRTTGKQPKSLPERWVEWFLSKEALDDRGLKSLSNRNTEQTGKKEYVVVSGTKKREKSFKPMWDELVNGETETSSPEKKNNNPIFKPIVAKKENLIEQRVEKQKKAVSENKQQKNVPTEASEKKQEETGDVLFAEAAFEIKKEKSLSSAVKPFRYNAKKHGKATYFFSGPIGGKFYMVTNLVAKGERVKVVNTVNGEYLIAKVICALPGNDLTKGLLLKISDHPKLPSGQKNCVFDIQIF